MKGEKDWVILSLGIYLRKPKTLIKKTYMHPYVHCSIIYDSQIWKQPKCPPVDKQIKQLWNTYLMEYYLATKKKKSSYLR